MTNTRRTDRGATLIELLIISVVMGLVATVLAFAFVAIIRSTPSTETRVDDARSLLGVTTYLPEDVNSTPPDAFDYSPSPATTGCLGATTNNKVQMTWTDLSTTYRSSYRYEPVSASPSANREIVRYTCTEGSPGVNRRVLTSELPPAFGAVTVTPVLDASSRDVGLRLDVTTSQGKILTVNARSNDPASTLPPVFIGSYPPIPPGNTAPTASPVATNIQQGSSRAVYLPGVDPDGDALVATVTNVPVAWTITVSGLVATVTPDPAATPPLQETFDYTVTDPFGQFATNTVTVDIVTTATNTPPTALDVTETIIEDTPFVINLPASDPEGDPLTVTTSGVDPSLTVAVSGLVMTVTSDGTIINPPTFTYTVDDGAFMATADVNLTVTVCTVTSFTSSQAVIERRNGNKRLVNDVVYTVAYTGPCNNLVLEYDHDVPPYDATYLSFGAGSTVTIDGHPGGLSPWSLGIHIMTLRDGFTGPVLASLNLEVIS